MNSHFVAPDAELRKMKVKELLDEFERANENYSECGSPDREDLARLRREIERRMK